MNFYKLPENGKTYLIKNFERDNKAYMGFAVENAFTPDYNLKARSVGSDKDSKSACWTIEESNGRYKFKNVATGLYMGKLPVLPIIPIILLMLQKQKRLIYIRMMVTDSELLQLDSMALINGTWQVAKTL